MTKHAPIAKDFSASIRKALAAKGAAIVGSTWLPGLDGSFANGERGYQIVQADTMLIRTYGGVIALASL